MGLFDNIKNLIKTVSDKIPELKDETLENIKKTGEDSFEITKEFVGDISDKVNDIAALTRLKFEMKSLRNEMDSLYQELGKIAHTYSKNKRVKRGLTQAEETINKIGKLQSVLNDKTAEYDRMQKERSDSYVVQKLSDELSAAGAIIDQTIVSEKSTISGKLLKEIVLPKEALITVVKRGPEVIIPDGNTKIFAGDLVTVSGIEEDVKKVIRRLSGGE